VTDPSTSGTTPPTPSPPRPTESRQRAAGLSADRIAASATAVGAAVGAFSLVVAVIAWWQGDKSTAGTQRLPAGEPTPTWVRYMLVTLLGVAVLSVISYLILRLRRDVEKDRREKQLADHERKAFDSAIDRLREKMALPSLIELNRLMLDSYHGIATTQAERSFKSSQNAMRIGFGWLLVCFGVGLVFPDRSATLVIGSLGVTGGALAAFLGRTYLLVYERSLQQLNQYFTQPLLNSHYLTAERLVSEMSPAAKDELLGDIVNALLDETRALSRSMNSAVPTQRQRTARRQRAAANGSTSATAQVEAAPNASEHRNRAS
jgi:hypothetical protein